MNKKLTLLTTTALAVGVVTVGALGTGMTVSAQEAEDNGEPSFVQMLAEKLGLPSEQVEEAVQETRDEIHSQKEADRQAAIDEAVANGDLTDRQAQILEALHDIREEKREEFENLSEEEREALREEKSEDREQARESKLAETIAALDERGISGVSEDELTELHETMRDLGIGGGHRHGGHHFGGMR